MSLDLEQFVDDWERPLNGSIAARLIRGTGGEEQLQLRVDLGLLQMFPDGRPDGRRFHGFPGTVDFVQHETRMHSKLPAEVWQEVDRELQQYNYRRLAFSGMAEDALQNRDRATAIDHLRRSVRDIDQCLLLLRTVEERQGGIPGAHASLIPSLLYNRAKMLARLREAQERFEEAVEALEGGIGSLEDILTRLGFDEHTRHHDPGLMYLRQTARDLRHSHRIESTLRERLSAAIGSEDFELAARLRDEYRRRETRSEFRLDWPRAEVDPQ